MSTVNNVLKCAAVIAFTISVNYTVHQLFYTVIVMI